MCNCKGKTLSSKCDIGFLVGLHFTPNLKFHIRAVLSQMGRICMTGLVTRCFCTTRTREQNWLLDPGPAKDFLVPEVGHQVLPSTPFAPLTFSVRPADKAEESDGLEWRWHSSPPLYSFTFPFPPFPVWGVEKEQWNRQVTLLAWSGLKGADLVLYRCQLEHWQYHPLPAQGDRLFRHDRPEGQSTR